jgi:hypothetical protein
MGIVSGEIVSMRSHAPRDIVASLKRVPPSRPAEPAPVVTSWVIGTRLDK